MTKNGYTSHAGLIAAMILCGNYVGYAGDIETSHSPTSTPAYITELKNKAQAKRDRKAAAKLSRHAH